MATRPRRLIVVAPPSNDLGMASSIVGIVALVFTCGLLSPLALVLAIASLRRAPRELGIVGAILGGAGTLWLLLYALLNTGMVVMVGQAAKSMTKRMDTAETLSQGLKRVEAYRAEEGYLPGEESGNSLLANLRDGWDNTLRYTRVEGGFELRSAGPDAAFDTDDDIVESTGDEIVESTGEPR